MTEQVLSFSDLLERSAQLADLGEIAHAIAVVESGLVRWPNALELKVQLAFLHARRNDRVTARRILTAVLTAVPEQPVVLAGLAQLAFLDGDYAAAAELYARVLALRPDDMAMRKDMAACQLEMGERALGEAGLRLAVRRAPNLAGKALAVLASASRGRFFLRPSAAASFLLG